LGRFSDLARLEQAREVVEPGDPQVAVQAAQRRRARAGRSRSTPAENDLRSSDSAWW
jgi:hypothetical protein